MTADTIVTITDKARAIMALAEERDVVLEAIRKEAERHQAAMYSLNARQKACEEAILKFNGPA